MKFRDAIERIFWTAVAAAGGAVAGAAIFDVEAWKAAASAACAAAIDAVLVIARWRLSVLPNPGAGLPGLPVEPKPVQGVGYVTVEIDGREVAKALRPRNEDGS